MGKSFTLLKRSAGKSDLILESADKTKKIRFDIINSQGKEPHVNIPTLRPRNKYPGDDKIVGLRNIHVFLKDTLKEENQRDVTDNQSCRLKNEKLIEIEQEALRLQNSGDYEGAIKLFQKILEEDPNWEWGTCYHCIAQCKEELGELEEAKEYYLKALECEPEDSIKIGGLASFLFQYGDPKEALKWYLELLRVDRRKGAKEDTVIIGIQILANKIGLSEEEISKIINDIK